ncbi:MAG: diguanylate cyclase [Candidatus Izemoplasmatales bacterium]|nr:diguanylate cyclase [Candidatus Izemoplasmatales bacterium]
MEDIFIYICLGTMGLLFILSSAIYRKVHIWKPILLVFFILIFVVIRFFSEWLSFIAVDKAKEYYEYLLYFGTVIFAITLKRKIRITQNLTDYDFFELEKELDDTKTASDLLRQRYIATIGLVNEALFFYNEDQNGLFVTDQFLEITKTTNHEYSLEEYTKMIHEDDRTAYLGIIKKANKKNPNYDMKYRILVGSGFIWVEERGRVFEFDKKIHIIGAVKPIDIKLFPDTSIHEIDSLPNEQNLLAYLLQATKETEPFYLIMIQLTNIPDINHRFGRDVGNLMIAEYIKKMRFHFAKDVNSVFRITGIQFALIIKEQRKYDVLYRALQSGGDLVNLMLNIGGIQQVVYPNLGIIRHEPWSEYSVSELTSLANKTLNEAIRNQKRNYSIYGE